MFKMLFKICMKFNITSILGFFYYLKTTAISKKKGKRFRFSALNYNRFNLDLEFFEKTGKLKIYKLPFSWKSRFLNYFFYKVDRSNIELKKEYEEFIFFTQFSKYFNVANSKKKFNKIIKEGFKHKNSFSKIFKYRKRLFNNYILPTSKKSLKTEEEKIKEIAFKNIIFSEKI